MDTATNHAATGPMNGARYLESLRDGRDVWYRGTRVADITTHPAFKPACDSLARIYDLQHDDATRDTMTYATSDRNRGSRSYLLPRSPDELLSRRRNAERWVRETFGMMGRYPDFCASMVVGVYDVRDELGALDPRFGDNAVRYHAYAQAHDLALSHGLHDPAMDKSLRPAEDPDRCVRIVEERDDGLVVRGARFSTLAPMTNEILVAPTYPLTKDEAEFAVWFAVPIATSGVKLLCRESYADGRGSFDHPAAVRFDEQDALVVFDDVLVPWERVFLARRPVEATRLLRGRVMAWAGYSSVVQFLGRLELMIGATHLLAETAGTAKRPQVMQEIGELITHTQMVRGALRAAEVDVQHTPGGLVALGPMGHVRAFVAMISERLVTLMEHVGTSSLIFTPTEEDFGSAELQPYLDRYGRGKGVPARTRMRLCKLAWDLTGDSFGARQQLYERLHSGDPAAIVAGVYAQYDKTEAIAQVQRLLALDDL